VLSHTRLFKDDDDNEYVDDNSSNYVFRMSCFYFRVFLYRFQFCFSKKNENREKKKKKKKSQPM